MVSVLVNLILARKQILMSQHLQPTVVLNEQGLPLPAVSSIFTFVLPSEKPGDHTSIPGLDLGSMVTERDKQLLPDDFKMDTSGNITFQDGSKVKVDLQALAVDLFVLVVVLGAMSVVCEMWIFKHRNPAT